MTPRESSVPGDIPSWKGEVLGSDEEEQESMPRSQEPHTDTASCDAGTEGGSSSEQKPTWLPKVRKLHGSQTHVLF